MSIKHYLVKLAEKRTGRSCSRCAHNRGGKCAHPSDSMFTKCWQSIKKPGFEKRQEPAAQEQAPAELTQEEQYQLQKIKEVLQEAEDAARDSGLLED